MMETTMQMKSSTYVPILALALFLIVAVLLGGCSTAPKDQGQPVNPAPGTLVTGERIAYTYAANTQIRSAAAALVKAKRISADQGQRILALTDMIRTGLDLASSSFYAGNLMEADRAFTKAEGLLSQASRQVDNATLGGTK